MEKSDDHKFWKLEMLAEASKTVLEEEEERIDCTMKSSSRPPKWLMKVMLEEENVYDAILFERIDCTMKSSSRPPKWLMKVMLEEENVYDAKLIIARRMHPSDLSKSQSRLSMPLNQLLSSDFLTEEETQILHEHSELKVRKEGVSLVLVDPLSNRHKVELRKWKVGVYSSYVIVGGWNNVVASNKFKAGDVIEIWSFRYGTGELCLALSPPVRVSRHPVRVALVAPDHTDT